MSADILDEAAEHTQHMIDLALANRSKPQMQFTGTCYYCEEKVLTGFFCSPECCQDYEKVERANKQRRVA
ncbi:hypothetical protein [Pantoea stewartii]|uniref:Uncharacterized protein n=1 Tax=Pantoea stewartii subsp. stewartii DC283 TaxID=660596 RepID=A0ABN4YXP2_PANSE|nr:hypothetical protein [Pantoea stewartii]ARF48863.1 hypothetical protein DSJ_05615 [Pantoea stewartii subsp. stewartii DC283]KAB0551633.1 hypothetical protein F7Q90_16940 [Pantoea stewartii subsp. stewartii]